MLTSGPQVAVIEGVDGSGKTFTARAGVEALSRSHPQHTFAVTDSNGLSYYRRGEKYSEQFTKLERIKKIGAGSCLGKLATVGAFTMARRYVEAEARKSGADLVVSVRDPARIDPAVYASVLGPRVLRHLSAGQRLQLLDSTTTLRPPSTVIQLDARLAEATQNLAVRDTHADHEVPEALMIIQEEMALVLAAHESLYGVPVEVIPALRKSTVDNLAYLLEPLLPVEPVNPPVAA